MTAMTNTGFQGNENRAQGFSAVFVAVVGTAR